MTPRRLKDHKHIWYHTSSDASENGYDRFACMGMDAPFTQKTTVEETCITISIPASLVHYLRSLLPLPEPREEEPLNIGAVIEDGGSKFVRICTVNKQFYHFSSDWMLTGGNPCSRGNYKFNDFKNPHVLSQGYVEENG